MRYPATGTVLIGTGTAPWAVLEVLGPKVLGPCCCWRLGASGAAGGVGTPFMISSRESPGFVPLQGVMFLTPAALAMCDHVDPLVIPE